MLRVLDANSVTGIGWPVHSIDSYLLNQLNNSLTPSAYDGTTGLSISSKNLLAFMVQVSSKLVLSVQTMNRGS